MRKELRTIFITALSLFGLSACIGEDNAGSDNPNAAITGYSADIDGWGKKKAYALNGENLFEGKTVKANGKTMNGASMTWKALSCGIGGFHRVDLGQQQYLLSSELAADSSFVYYGPFAYVGMFYDDLAPAARPTDKGICYIDKSGKIAFWADAKLGKKVRRAYNFMGGLSIVEVSVASGEAPKYGAIDKEGNIAFQPIYDRLEYLGDNLWLACNSASESNIINSKGEPVLTFPEGKYQFSDNTYNAPKEFTFSGGVGLLIRNQDSGWEIIDTSGKELSNSIEGIRPLSHVGDHFVYTNNRTGLGIMDATGKSIVDAKFNSIFPHEDNFIGFTDEGRTSSSESTVYSYDGKAIGTIDGSARNLPLSGYFITETERGNFAVYDKNLKLLNNIKAAALSYWDKDIMKPACSPSSSDSLWMPDNEIGKSVTATEKPEKKAASADLATFDLQGPVSRCETLVNGYVTETLKFDRDGNLTVDAEIKVERDNAGRIIRITVPEEDDLGNPTQSITEYHYDKQGCLVTIINSNDYYAAKEEISRDEDGKIIRSNITDTVDPTVFTYEYQKTDRNDNWIRRIRKDSTGGKEIQTRRIAYY